MLKKSKSLLKLSLAGLVLVPAASGVAWAATVLGSGNGPLIVPTDPEQSTTLAQRVSQRKNTLKLSLNIAQSQDIAKKCPVAQTALQQIKTKDQAADATRQQVYQSLATQLATTIDNLQRQGVNVEALTAAQTKFDNSIDQYLTDYETYKTAMDDVVVMNCASDPVGFSATLQSARDGRSKLATDAGQIKASAPTLSQALATAESSLTHSATPSKGASRQ